MTYMPNFLLVIFQLIVLIFSVIIHEISHGLTALRLGDTTAKDMGRLTLNPLAHLELFGSFILPLMLYVVSGGAFVFGWAKPVPYDPTRLKNPLRAAGLIALAGPASNLIIAAIFGIFIRLSVPFQANFPVMILFFNLIVIINILLAIFNLVPLPPLDGSKVLFALLPPRFYEARVWLERYGFFLLLMFVFFGFQFIAPVVDIIYRLFVGGGAL